MWPTEFSPKAQQLIDRLAAIDYENPKICQQRIQDAFSQHLKALNLRDRPIKIYDQSLEDLDRYTLLDTFDAEWYWAYKAMLEAAWPYQIPSYAAWEATRNSVRDAAWDTIFNRFNEDLYDFDWSFEKSLPSGSADQAGRYAMKAVECVNSKASSPQHDQFCAVWMPFVDALEAGLFWFWVTPTEVMVLTLPVMRFQDNQLHAEDGQPALVWSNGAEYYFWQGIHVFDEESIFSNKYGDVSESWKSEWLLEESNAEFRRVLIQGIGYERIVQDLEAVEIDTWREYSLLKIEADIDVEPIYLLKMTCPSTNHIHVLRTPPDITSAREAIAWCNWEIDPEQFSVES
ncbi:hypothetical protein NDA03_26410 [Trichocoleus sp. Lan]|uniref:DUF6745 domain-containing protein n=1 Tax=Trichocoleus sp. Lan TaxID=2933927 RepID=UPI0032995AB6